MNGNAMTSAGFYRRPKFFKLLSNLRRDFLEVVKSELNLLKSEISGAISLMGKDGLTILVGGFIVYAGAGLAMVGMAVFIAFALHAAGLSMLISTAISFVAFGVLVGGTGYFVLNSGLARFKKDLAASKEAMKNDMSGSAVVTNRDPKDEKGKETAEARVAVEKKTDKIHAELAEMKARLQPQYLWKVACTAVKRRPKTAAGVGAAIIGLGYLIVKRRQNYEAVRN